MRQFRRTLLTHLFGASLLLLHDAANAEIYQCVDPATGKKTFSDRACPDQSRGQELQVNSPAPGGSGAAESPPGNGSASKRSGPEQSNYVRQARAKEKQRADSAARGTQRELD